MVVSTEQRVERARQSLRLSGIAWCVLLGGLVVGPRVLAGGIDLSAYGRLVGPVVLVAYAVLSVLAVRRALQGRGTGAPESRRAVVVAWIDVVGLVLVVLGVALIAWLAYSISHCTSCFVF